MSHDALFQLGMGSDSLYASQTEEPAAGRTINAPCGRDDITSQETGLAATASAGER